MKDVRAAAAQFEAVQGNKRANLEAVRRFAAQASERGVPFSELLAFMKLNWRTFASHFLSFSIVSTLGFGTVAWIPSYFIRVHHWAAHDLLVSIDPTIQLQRDVRVVADTIFTSAGVSAGLDMAFAVVEQLHGAEVARETARYIEYVPQYQDTV